MVVTNPINLSLQLYNVFLMPVSLSNCTYSSTNPIATLHLVPLFPFNNVSVSKSHAYM